MKTTTYVAATAAIVVAGKWANGKPLDIKLAIGTGAYAIGLSLLNNANDELADKLAVLVLLTAAFLYVPTIATKTGLSGKKK